MSHWERREELAAPLSFEGKRSTAFWRCALIRNVSGGPCEVGFRDHKDNIISLDELEREVEAYVPKLKLKPPYQFFVLTISPTVIMFVPGRPWATMLCRGEDYRAGCFATPKIPDSEFQYGPRPQVAAGSFIFVPSLKDDPTFIPPESKSFQFALADSILELTSDGMHWNVLRRHKQ